MKPLIYEVVSDKGGVMTITSPDGQSYELIEGQTVIIKSVKIWNDETHKEEYCWIVSEIINSN